MNLSPGAVDLLIGAGFTRSELEAIFSRRVWHPAAPPAPPKPKPKRMPAPRPKPVTAAQAERDAEFRRLYGEWRPYREISEATGIPIGSFGSHIRRLGLPPHNGLRKRPA